MPPSDSARLAELEVELSNLKTVFKSREKVLFSLLSRVAQCEAMAGIQSNAGVQQIPDSAILNNDFSPGSLSVVD